MPIGKKNKAKVKNHPNVKENGTPITPSPAQLQRSLRIALPQFNIPNIVKIIKADGINKRLAHVMEAPK